MQSGRRPQRPRPASRASRAPPWCPTADSRSCPRPSSSPDAPQATTGAVVLRLHVFLLFGRSMSGQHHSGLVSLQCFVVHTCTTILASVHPLSSSTSVHPRRRKTDPQGQWRLAKAAFRGLGVASAPTSTAPASRAPRERRFRYFEEPSEEEKSAETDGRRKAGRGSRKAPSQGRDRDDGRHGGAAMFAAAQRGIGERRGRRCGMRLLLLRVCGALIFKPPRDPLPFQRESATARRRLSGNLECTKPCKSALRSPWAANPYDGPCSFLSPLTTAPRFLFLPGASAVALARKTRRQPAAGRG